MKAITYSKHESDNLYTFVISCEQELTLTMTNEASGLSDETRVMTLPDMDNMTIQLEQNGFIITEITSL